MDVLLCMLVLMTAIVSTSGQTNWEQMAVDELTEAINLKQNNNIAKNIIIFIGDGMGVSTVTAGRIYRGQMNGNPGEETRLNFEKFPYTGLSKVYGSDRQVPDSAQTATAFLGGVKTNWQVLGLTDAVEIGNCESSKAAGVRVTSILEHAISAGKSTGIVTTARITHATPAGAYAHTPSRNWESDANMQGVTGGCEDIAYQLVYNNRDIQVLLGGGRRSFLPDNEEDPETGTIDGNQRTDQANLTKIWEQTQNSLNRNYEYVWNKGQFDSVDPQQTDYLLGLFNPGHMQYEIERNNGSLGEPSLAEMTSKAIQILKKKDEGFFLLVEAGRIDHGHHESIAKKALEDLLALEDAVAEADRLTDDDDTLIIVTADHSHAFTITGYTYRGNDILGLVNPLDASYPSDGLPYTTLLYGNGPGWQNGTRENLTDVDTTAADYIQASAVPMSSETHSGEDVTIYAKGPMAHLFHNIHEQNYIALVMQYSACIGRYTGAPCTDRTKENKDPNGSSKNNYNCYVMGLLLSFIFFLSKWQF